MQICIAIFSLQKTVLSNFPLLLINKTSKNDILPLCSSLYVNLVLSWNLVKLFMTSMMKSGLIKVVVLFTHLFQGFINFSSSSLSILCKCTIIALPTLDQEGIPWQYHFFYCHKFFSVFHQLCNLAKP